MLRYMKDKRELGFFEPRPLRSTLQLVSNSRGGWIDLGGVDDPVAVVLVVLFALFLSSLLLGLRTGRLRRCRRVGRRRLRRRRRRRCC